MTEKTEHEIADEGPLILVGQPRSGSTLLTRMLNESTDLYILNDLYILQEVDACRGWESLGEQGAGRMLQKLSKVIYRRSSPEKGGKSLANSSPMDPQAYSRTQSFIESDAVPRDSWSALLKSVIGYAAAQSGASIWGYNTPQDYLHLSRIYKAFPDARVIFLMRDPRDMIKSYKYHGKEDYSQRYHPAAQALAWRSAARSYESAQQKWVNRVLLVRYDDLIEKPQLQMDRISKFVERKLPFRPLDTLGSNSSFEVQGTARKDERWLNPTEIWIADRFLQRERRALGYQYSAESPRLRDLPSLLGVSLVFGLHYARKILFDPDTRTRVIRLVQANLKR